MSEWRANHESFEDSCLARRFGRLARGLRQGVPRAIFGPGFRRSSARLRRQDPSVSDETMCLLAGMSRSRRSQRDNGAIGRIVSTGFRRVERNPVLGAFAEAAGGAGRRRPAPFSRARERRCRFRARESGASKDSPTFRRTMVVRETPGSSPEGRRARTSLRRASVLDRSAAR